MQSSHSALFDAYKTGFEACSPHIPDLNGIKVGGSPLGRLGSVIVGQAPVGVPPADAVMRASSPPDDWSWFKTHQGEAFPGEDRASQELDDFSNKLNQIGMTTLRPGVYQQHQDRGLPYATVPRDRLLFLDMGSQVLCIIGEPAMVSRRPEIGAIAPLLEAVGKELENQGRQLNVKISPVPDYENLDEHYGDGLEREERNRRAARLEFVSSKMMRPVLDPADVLPLGQDLFVQVSQVTNFPAVEWLAEQVSPYGVRVHVIQFKDPNPRHIDATFRVLREGLVMTNPERLCVNDDSYEVLNKVADALGIVDATINVQTQYTGQMHHLHIDALAGLGPRHSVSDVQENEDEYIRVFVTLQDWTMGHIIQFGNTYYKQWKAGEVVWFSWQDTPHSTANTSHTPRTIIKLTGRKTDFTRYLLAHGHRSYEISLS